MSAIELKPCPFCGEKPESGPWDDHGFAIQCSSNLSKCPINPACSGYDHQATIERWNTRAPQWQPIESIPNGQLALFCDMAAAELRSSFFVDWVVDGKFCGNRHHTATHWMPLPAAPEVSP